MMQQLLFEAGALNSLKQQLDSGHISKILLICGHHSLQNGTIDRVRSIIHPSEIDLIVKNGPNVDTIEIEVGYKKFHSIDYNAIIAIGGGSVIDFAKGILYRNILQENARDIFFIVVPTTAGSGSEATSFAVVYDNKRKTSIQHPSLKPQVVILDPELTYSLSPTQTAISGTDAFCQAIESMWNIHATEVSVEWAGESLRLSIDWLDRSVSNPSVEERKQMLWAAHLAGKAIDLTRTTAAHALSYYLTGHYNIPHGQAVAMFLPILFLYNEPGLIKNKNVLLRMQQLYKILDIKDALGGYSYTRKFINNLGLATSFPEAGIDKEKILMPLLNEVNTERFDNNPVAFDHDRLLNLCNQYL